MANFPPASSLNADVIENLDAEIVSAMLADGKYISQLVKVDASIIGMLSMKQAQLASAEAVAEATSKSTNYGDQEKLLTGKDTLTVTFPSVGSACGILRTLLRQLGTTAQEARKVLEEGGSTSSRPFPSERYLAVLSLSQALATALKGHCPKTAKACSPKLGEFDPKQPTRSHFHMLDGAFRAVKHAENYFPIVKVNNKKVNFSVKESGGVFCTPESKKLLIARKRQNSILADIAKKLEK